LLVVISGPSGVGKDTIIRELRERHPDPRRHFVVTYKTRPPRDYEVDGRDYHFVTVDDFRALEEGGAFLEVANVHGHWSGTPRDQVELALQSGRDAILKIDVQGARAVKEQVADALLIFVAPPSFETLEDRLRDRGTESPDEMERRQRDAATELARQDLYDHVVVNETGRVGETADRIHAILIEEHRSHPDRRVAL
jgi:guanylate kinase